MPTQPPTTAWVSTTDGGHAQVCHIVRFAQQTGSQIVQLWLVNGQFAKSADSAFFPPALQKTAEQYPADHPVQGDLGSVPT